jgi:hypothetical protein
MTVQNPACPGKIALFHGFYIEPLAGADFIFLA